MRSLFNIHDSLANKISYYHLMLLMASLPFDRFYSHLILISYGIHTLIQLKRGTIKPVFKLRTLVLQSVFLVTVLSTIYSTNTHEAFTEWGKHVTIFLIPLFFCLNPLDIKKYRQQLLLSFALVCSVTIIYLYADAIITIRHYGLPFSILLSGAFTNHNFSEPIGMHATFFSMQVTIALVYMLSVLIKEQALYKRLFYLACSIVLTAGLVQLCSKSIFVVMLIIMNIALPYFLLKGTKRWKFVAVSVSFSVLQLIGILYSGTFRDRFVKELKQDLSKEKVTETTDGRLARWSVVTELISKSPVLGYGAGTEIALLQDGFYNKKLYNSYLFRLNAHNEYLSFWLKAGIIGLLFYLATLVFGFKIAFKEQDLLFFTFMLLMAIVSLSENVLDVDKGIFFYAFFYSFFTFSNERTAISPNIKQPAIQVRKLRLEKRMANV
jgi:O-antigen ligase